MTAGRAVSASNDHQTLRSQQVRGSRPAGPRRQPAASSSPDRHAALAGLSAAISHLRALHDHHVDDPSLCGQLGRAAAQLESLVANLSYPSEPNPSNGPSAAGSPSPPRAVARQAHLEARFAAWLASTAKPDELQPDGADLAGVPLARALGELSLSPRPLPVELAATVGLPAGTTIGAAATELLLAVTDPAGPRCRSYRAAANHLRDVDRSDLDVTDVRETIDE